MNALDSLHLSEFTKKPESEALMSALLTLVKADTLEKAGANPDEYLDLSYPVIEKDYAFALCEQGGVEFIRFLVLQKGQTPLGYCLVYGSQDDQGVRGSHLHLRVEELWIASSARGLGASRLFLAAVLRLAEEKLKGCAGNSKITLNGVAASLSGNRFFESVVTLLSQKTSHTIIPNWDNAYLQFAHPDLGLRSTELEEEPFA